MEDEPIYEFPLFRAALLRKGIDVGQTGGYTIVRPADVVFSDGHGNVEFANDRGQPGIFVKDKRGRYHQVFMYKRDYHLERFGKPRFHICNCTTIQDFIKSGGFRDHYRYANTEEVPVIDMDNYDRETTVDSLPLCHYCADILGGQYRKHMPVEEFIDILKAAGEADREEEHEVDIFGYVRDWPQISTAYRNIRNYTCERCGYRAETALEQRFIQVHHIDGDKLNNNQNNLQCLCIHCHANVDATHRRNFGAGANADMLEEFEHHLLVRRNQGNHITNYGTIHINDNSTIVR